MCRFVAYLGKETLLESVLVKPSNSIIAQSKHARETTHTTNGDGFGLGWYAPEISPEPGLFKAISPAWNNQNLLHLAAKIKSSCFCGHVRAATNGNVSDGNCHPFAWQHYLFMHNGGVGNFIKVKRHLRHQLDDDVYEWIKGETDTEHIYAMFIQCLKDYQNPGTAEIITALKQTITRLNKLVDQYGGGEVSHYNLCFTNGKQLFATRYSSNPNTSPAASLYYSLGSEFAFTQGDSHMEKVDKGECDCALVCSERLNDSYVEWHLMKENSMIVIENDMSVQMHDL